MPYIVARIGQGLTLEQKREFVKDVTEVVAKKLDIPIENVAMELEEFPPENMA